MTNSVSWQDKVIENREISYAVNCLLQDILPLKTDSYKISHWKMLPEGTDGFFSYGESRGAGHGIKKTVMWGLTAIIKKYFTKQITMSDIKRAKRFADRHLRPGAFNFEGWKYIVEEHNGYLPLEVWAVPEGTVLDPKNVLYSVEVTDEKCAWLVSYFEPLWLQIWYPITVASLSYQLRENIGKFWSETVDDDRMGGLDFALHDFGFRGVSSPESAAIGGSGHLLNFMGTDTMQAIACLYDFYGLDEEDDTSMPAFSVYATEHSVMCANSNAEEREDIDALEMTVRLLETEGGIISSVIDTYEPYRYTSRIGSKEYRERIIAACEKFPGSRYVLRPDSGDETVVPIQIIQMLMNDFGYTINKKGFKVLPDCVRVLQGDGINMDSINEILLKMRSLGISAENIIFGMGGALLQHCDRDWMKFAQKGSGIRINGVWKDLFKDPSTDPGKQSKKGRVETVLKNGEHVSQKIEDFNDDTDKPAMKLALRNGVLFNEENFKTIKNRVIASRSY